LSSKAPIPIDTNDALIKASFQPALKDMKLCMRKNSLSVACHGPSLTRHNQSEAAAYSLATESSSLS
jgi:hypothetical protein